MDLQVLLPAMKEFMLSFLCDGANLDPDSSLKDDFAFYSGISFFFYLLISFFYFVIVFFLFFPIASFRFVG